MKRFLFFLLIVSVNAQAQRLKKADKQVISNLKQHISYLSDDKLEGRRTGTPGEKLAYTYIAGELEKEGIAPRGENGGYLQTFDVNEGKMILPSTTFSVDGKALVVEKDFFPFVFSSNAKVEAYASPAIKESDAPWFLDLDKLVTDNVDNPHFDLAESIREQALSAQKKGANALIVTNSGKTDPDLKFEGKSKTATIGIPVIFVSQKATESYFGESSENHEIKLEVAIGDKTRTGTNVIGFIDRGAPHTIVIGAHFDHLGYGEDHNSLWTGKPEIHNGADDNASGTAAVLELARLLKNSKLSGNNYLFIFFSGEELGLYGSKYFTDHPTVPLNSINYMINLDMVGRLHDDTKAITIGGYGTSPAWSNVLEETTKTIHAKFDSSGIGPSDHTSFYLKDIPVLFFFTGTHTDYHKPTDDADKINFNGELFLIRYIYNLLEKTDRSDKLAFLKTREPKMAGTRFTVSLGIMPDYTYSGTGVHIDGIIDGRVAAKADMKAGDVVLKIGEYTTNDINEYMTALSKFKKGDATTVIVKRNDEELRFEIVF